MTPLEYFDMAWERCEHLSALHSYLDTNLTSALKPDELLRAEWSARVGALDLYVHELVSQRMLEIFEGVREPSKGYGGFHISNDTLTAVKGSDTAFSSQAFDLEVRRKLGFMSFQHPEKIADGIRLFSDIELWNEIALKNGAEEKDKVKEARKKKRKLSLIADRRNKIVHESDLRPEFPRSAWSIDKDDLGYVREEVFGLVITIDCVCS